MVKRNRVVITGMGVLAPNGIGLEAFWDSLLNAVAALDRSRFLTPQQFQKPNRRGNEEF